MTWCTGGLWEQPRQLLHPGPYTSTLCHDCIGSNTVFSLFCFFAFLSAYIFWSFRAQVAPQGVLLMTHFSSFVLDMMSSFQLTKIKVISPSVRRLDSAIRFWKT